MAFTPQFTPLSTLLFFCRQSAAGDIRCDDFRRRFSFGLIPGGRCRRAGLPEGVGAVGSDEVLPADRKEPGRGYGEKVFQGRYRTAGPLFMRENFKNQKDNFH